MKNKHPDFLKGHLLIAMPNLADPNFAQSVTCICEHTAEGAVGLTINRRHPSLTGRHIFDELDISCYPHTEALPIYIGGPVHMGEIFILHGRPFQWEGSLMVTPEVAMSNTRDILESIAQGRGPSSFIITLGCAGWGANQLETEIKANAWLTCPATVDLLFAVPSESCWEEAMKTVGVDPRMLSETAGQA